MRAVVSAIVALVLFIFVGFLVYSGNVISPDYWTQLAVALTLTAFGVLYWGFRPTINEYFWKRKRLRKTDPKFAHLTILYSQRMDTPDTPNPARPRYVLNNRKNQAHLVSTSLEPHIAQHRINWHTFEGKEALMRYFRKNKVDVHEHDPTADDLEIALE